MPIVATPAVNPSAPTITVDMVRLFLRDYSNNNILLDDVQFQDTDVNQAMTMMANQFSVMNPISNDTVASIPPAILIIGTASWLMSSEAFLQIRNQATYQDGEISGIGIDDKTQLYQQLSAKLKEEWQTLARGYKTQRNLESAYGFLSSGYRNVGRFHNS